MKNLLKVCGIVVLVMAVGCLKDRSLGNGYVLEYFNGCEVAIFNVKQDNEDLRLAKMRFGGCQRSTGFFLANDTFLDGNIESYAVNGNWVTGFTSAKCLDKEGRAICEGYYLLNTLSHNSMEGMSLQEWEQALKEIGWKSPNLIKLKKTR